MLIVNGLRTKAGGPVGFSLHGGEIVAVRGPSGSGKSLMLRAIADLDPAEGEITLDGTIVWDFYNPHRAGKNDEFIATLFRMDRLPPDFPIPTR